MVCGGFPGERTRTASTGGGVASDNQGRWLRPDARQIFICVGAARNRAHHVRAFAVKLAAAEGAHKIAQAGGAGAAEREAERAQRGAGKRESA